MKDLFRTTLLYDFYGELLTVKQKRVFELYYLEDLSLSEIAQELEISRQAVRDLITRTEAILFGYEKKLGLADRFREQKEQAKEIRDILEEIESNPDIPQALKKEIEKAKYLADELMK